MGYKGTIYIKSQKSNFVESYTCNPVNLWEYSGKKTQFFYGIQQKARIFHEQSKHSRACPYFSHNFILFPSFR